MPLPNSRQRKRRTSYSCDVSRHMAHLSLAEQVFPALNGGESAQAEMRSLAIVEPQECGRRTAGRRVFMQPLRVGLQSVRWVLSVGCEPAQPTES